ncbi:MAG: ferrous iron transport protein B [Saprospiraceae bacterium]|nr:ferrous iron transport protein B [Saprospiraceae bacterium]
MGRIHGLRGRIAVIGNPNSGKSSLFNHLTGLRQKTGNFPGVTVERRSGALRLPDGTDIQVVDFPGTYSLYPTSLDERVVFDVLSNPKGEDFPDLVIYVADAMRLDQHLLLLSQIRDLGIPVLLALNLIDSAVASGVRFDAHALGIRLGIPTIEVNGRTGEGTGLLIQQIEHLYNDIWTEHSQAAPFTLTPAMQDLVRDIREAFPWVTRDYQALIIAHHLHELTYLQPEEVEQIHEILQRHPFVSLRAQVDEIMERFQHIDRIVKEVRNQEGGHRNRLTARVDRVFTHVVWGPMIFVIFLMFIFQAVFTWSTLPMEWIERIFSELGGGIKYALGEGWLSSLLADGVVAGLGGVLVFIPQIVLLFLLVALLEESGYMARAVYLFDRLLRKVGLNGRSIVALVSGTACAIPAVMSTRTITNQKERLITILVTPFISCSARLPVYALLIGLMVPAGKVLGLVSYQALTFMGLYVLGAAAAMVGAWVFNRVLKTEEPGYLLMELPDYQVPHWRNVVFTVWSKVASFVREAGKIIIMISIVLWFLASFSLPGRMALAEEAARTEAAIQGLDEGETEALIASQKIESSYAGMLGKGLEPVIRPLGFDWKIGIALVTSFAAREVFVGTMATIYSIGSVDDESSIRQKMGAELNPVTGRKKYSFPVALSLLLFYVFAMQCMSTIAVVKKETGTWKWPLIQLVVMTGLAYVVSLIAYQGLTALGY